MKTKIQSIHFDADSKLVDFIQKRMDKLDRFFNHIIDGEVFLRLNDDKIENKMVEIKINAPGKQLFAKEHARTFEAATDQATEALRHQLEKLKSKMMA